MSFSFANSDGTMTMVIENPANHTYSNGSGRTVATIYKGVKTSLIVTLTNNSGEDIELSSSSTLEIQLPNFLSNYLSGIKFVDLPPNWGAATLNSFIFTIPYTSESGIWNQDEKLKFTVDNILTEVPPPDNPEPLTIQLTANQILSTYKNVALTNSPVKGNIDLPTVLKVSLQHDHIFVSDPHNPLSDPNKLKLTFTNLTQESLSFDSELGSPRVTVSFVYGNTAGSIAPLKNVIEDQGSAWNITASYSGTEWQVKNPKKTSDTEINDYYESAGSPQWKCIPLDGTIVGTGDQSTVTFDFNNIVSFTPVGATVMYIHFQGFQITKDKAYNDCYFVLPIYKDSITPQIISFTLDPTIIRYQPDGNLDTFVTPSWEISPPPGKNQSDVDLSLKFTSTRNPANNKITSIQHSANNQQLNLKTYCTWCDDLSNELGIEVELIASVSSPDQEFEHNK